MAKYSLTKGPVADNVWALTKDPDATKIEITKNPGFDTVAFSKNAATQVSLENAGGGGGIVASTDFIFTVETTGAENFTIACANFGTFNAVIDWGDASPTSNITAWNDADLTHSYAGAGTWTISISGVFPNIAMSTSVDKAKIKTVEQLGIVGWQLLNVAFYGCSGMTSFNAGTHAVTCDTSSVTSIGSLLRDCIALTSCDVTGLNTSSVNTMISAFRNMDVLTSIDVTGFDTSGVTTIASMFRDCTLLETVDISGFNITALTSATSMFLNANANCLGTPIYDATLIAWEAQSVPNVDAHFGTSTTYTGGGAAATARADLITNGWSITDGGVA